VLLFPFLPQLPVVSASAAASAIGERERSAVVVIRMCVLSIILWLMPVCQKNKKTTGATNQKSLSRSDPNYVFITAVTEFRGLLMRVLLQRIDTGTVCAILRYTSIIVTTSANSRERRDW
jgi:hypothetical protein